MFAQHQQETMERSIERSVERRNPFMSLTSDVERRRHRRHDLEDRNLPVERWDAVREQGVEIGTIVDLSSTGLRFKCKSTTLKADSHVRVRLLLPTSAGISPFIDHDHDMAPKSDWVGWMVITRVTKNKESGMTEIAGRLVDMDEMDRGMLGLYLSIQPLAA